MISLFTRFNVQHSPVHILSPKKWHTHSESKCETGETAIGDTTILFWDKRMYSKLIPHHPEMGTQYFY